MQRALLSAAQDSATAHGCNTRRAPASAGELVFAQDAREHAHGDPLTPSQHSARTTCWQRFALGAGTAPAVLQPVQRDPQALLKTAFSLPGGPCTGVELTCQEARLLNYLMCFLACMCVSMPTVVLPLPRLLPQLARPRSHWRGAVLRHSSAASLHNQHLTSELKSGQRFRAIKSVSLQICQMGNLLKEAGAVAGEMRFWR